MAGRLGLRLKPVLFYKREERAKAFKLEFVWMPILFMVGGAIVAGSWALMGLGNFRNYWMVALFLSLLGLVFGFAVALHHRFMSAGELRKTTEII